jgi:hypothetical protein
VMSYSVEFRQNDGSGEVDGPFELCSVTAWTRFSEWVEGLPPRFTFLRELVRSGSVTNTSALADEIAASVAQSPNERSDTVSKLLYKMSELIGVGAEHEQLDIGS